jgi:hypothetical protein
MEAKFLSSRFTRRSFLAGLGAAAALPILAACEPQIVEKTVEVPVVVKETVIVQEVVEKEVVVEKPVEIEKQVVVEVEKEKIVDRVVMVTPTRAAMTGKITILVGDEYGLTTPETRTPIAQSILDLFDEYQRDVQPGVKLELEEIVTPAGSHYYETQRTRAIAGNIPDLNIFEPRPSTMNPGLFYQIPQFVLDEPNPYSKNARWWDDFPFDGISFGGYAGAEPGSYWQVAMTRTGAGGALGMGYNRDLFEKAGIGPALTNPPKDWAEFMDWHKRLRAIGVVPFDTQAPWATRSIYAIPWFHGAIYDNIIEDHHDGLEREATSFFGEEFSGMMSPKHGVYLFKTDRWTFDDEHTEAYLEIYKEWSQYFQPGYRADQTKSLFLSGEAGMTFALINQAYQWPELLKGKFKWGIFMWPSITSTTWDGAPGLPQRPPGATGQAGSYARGAQFMIPQRTVKEGRFPLVLDLLHWLTAPAQLAKFAQTISPRSAPPGSKVKDVYPEDEEEQHRWQFHYEPKSILEGNKRYGWEEWWHLAGPGLEAPMTKINEQWLSGQIGTSREAAAEMHKQALEANSRWVAQNPDFEPKPDTWK